MFSLTSGSLWILTLQYFMVHELTLPCPSSSSEISGDLLLVLSVCGWTITSRHTDDLIIITSSLGRVLRGGVNAQWVKAFLGDMEHFGILRDGRVCMGSVRWGKTKASSAMVWMKNTPERVYCGPAFRDVLFMADLFCCCLFMLTFHAVGRCGTV